MDRRNYKTIGDKSFYLIKISFIFICKTLLKIYRYAFRYENWVFLKAIYNNPRATGAVAPSSKKLAYHVAQQVPLDAEGIVVELGAGTGAITHALLRHGIPAEQLIVIEQSAHMVKFLRTLYPHITIIEGDALYLNDFLQNTIQIKAIVSGIPLRSLISEQARALGLALEKAMQKNTLFIQFTYSFFANYNFFSQKLKRIGYCFVWHNMPPARIDIFVKK